MNLRETEPCAAGRFEFERYMEAWRNFLAEKGLVDDDDWPVFQDMCERNGTPVSRGVDPWCYY